MSKKVVDACVFVKIFIKEEDSGQAKALLKNFLYEEHDILVPRLFLFEVIEQLVQHKIDQSNSLKVLDLYDTVLIYKELDHQLVSKAWQLVEQCSSEKSGRPSFYDAVYHALAIMQNCDFITADKKHYAKTKDLGHIILLEDYPI